MRLTDDAAKFPDQRYDRMASAREAFIDPGAVHQGQFRFRGDRLGGGGGDDAELGLGSGQRGLNVKPGLPAIFQLVERADAQIRNAGGGQGECRS